MQCKSLQSYTEMRLFCWNTSAFITEEKTGFASTLTACVLSEPLAHWNHAFKIKMNDTSLVPTEVFAKDNTDTKKGVNSNPIVNTTSKNRVDGKKRFQGKVLCHWANGFVVWLELLKICVYVSINVSINRIIERLLNWAEYLEKLYFRKESTPGLYKSLGIILNEINFLENRSCRFHQGLCGHDFELCDPLDA